MKLSEALAICIQAPYLYQSGQRYSAQGHVYICLAIESAHKDGLISEEVKAQLKRKVYRAMPGSITLAAYFDSNRKLPRVIYENEADDGVSIIRSYNLFHPEYIALRDKFIGDLMEILKEEERLGISFYPG